MAAEDTLASGALPQFVDNVGNTKNVPLSDADIAAYNCNPAIEAMLADFCRTRGREKSSLRILDFGCGKGTLVGYLRAKGYSAFGVDIDPCYLKNGRVLDRYVEGRPILSLIGQNGRTEFADASFDVVVSDQVIEHVHELETVGREIARLTAPGGVGLHIFPPATSIMEVHLGMPLVHWFPAGKLQTAFVKAFLRAGIGAKYFTELSLDQRTEIYTRFLKTDTCYRSVRAASDILTKQGLSADALRGMTFKANGMKSGYARAALSFPIISYGFCMLYTTFRGAYLATVKESGKRNGIAVRKV
ncbi:MAG TPA: class I SAM-dependent methyltransferase [Steroidobacteraceae bacterium]|nr:class I SAM-dependent methyltransferase [Steroidobacteraceae bacterium]